MRARESSDGSGRYAILAMVVFASLLAVVAYWGRPQVRLRPQSPPSRPRLAVVPFENLTGDAELEVLASEVTAKLTERLRAAEEIAFDIVPRETTLAYKDLPGGLDGVAEATDADYLVAGSIDRSGERIAVDAYVYFFAREPRLWAERFEWSPSDRDSIPEEMGVRIESALAGR